MHLLGRFRVLVETASSRTSLEEAEGAAAPKCLLTRPHRRMTVDEAIDIFWPEHQTLMPRRGRSARRSARSGPHWAPLEPPAARAW